MVSTSDTYVVSTLCNIENPTSDFVSFTMSYQRYSNIEVLAGLLHHEARFPDLFLKLVDQSAKFGTLKSNGCERSVC